MRKDVIIGQDGPGADNVGNVDGRVGDGKFVRLNVGKKCCRRAAKGLVPIEIKLGTFGADGQGNAVPLAVGDGGGVFNVEILHPIGGMRCDVRIIIFNPDRQLPRGGVGLDERAVNGGPNAGEYRTCMIWGGP